MKEHDNPYIESTEEAKEQAQEVRDLRKKKQRAVYDEVGHSIAELLDGMDAEELETAVEFLTQEAVVYAVLVERKAISGEQAIRMLALMYGLQGVMKEMEKRGAL